MENAKKNPQDAYDFLKKYGMIDDKEDPITALKKYVQQPIDQCTEELKYGTKTISLWDIILKIFFGIAKIITGQEQQQKAQEPKITACPKGFIFSENGGFPITQKNIDELLASETSSTHLASGIELKTSECRGYIKPNGNFVKITKEGFPYTVPPGSKIVMYGMHGINKNDNNDMIFCPTVLQDLAALEKLAKQQKDDAAANPAQEGASEEHSATEAQQNTETQASEQAAKTDETPVNPVQETSSETQSPKPEETSVQNMSSEENSQAQQKTETQESEQAAKADEAPANPVQETSSETQSPKPEEASVQKMSSEENSQAPEHAAENTEKTSDSTASAVDSKTQADNQPAKKPAMPEVRASSFDLKPESPVQEFMYKRAQQQLEEAQKMDTYNNSSTEMYGPENWKENWWRDQQKKSEMFSPWQETIDKINNERLSSQQASETQEQNTIQPGM